MYKIILWIYFFGKHYLLIQKNQKMGQQDQMWIFFFWLDEGPPPHSEELETGSANDLVKWKCTLNHWSKGNSRMYKIMLSIFSFGLKKDLLLIQKNQKLVQQMILWSENAILTTKLMAKAKMYTRLCCVPQKIHECTAASHSLEYIVTQDFPMKRKH
jgi:hypothetical protein